MANSMALMALLWAGPMLADGDLLTGPVTHIRDGDTLEVGGVPVRLEGLHCPEWDEPGGEAATVALRALVGSRPVSCLNGERTHDRCVGRCEVEGRDLGAELIVSGHCTRCLRHDEERRYADLPAPPWRGEVPGYCEPR